MEKAERGKKAQLAYSFDIALQNEFSLEENIALARQFVSEQLVGRGMIADFTIHQPDKEDGGIPNPHFHVLCPIRPVEDSGKWGLKQRRVYRLDEDGNRIMGEDGKPLFDAVPTTDWGSPETLEHWREAWAAMVNAKFEEKRKITDLDAMKIQEQKKAVRSGYDMDILPSDLATYGTDAKQLLSKLQTRNERLFMVTFLVLNMDDTQRKLSNEVFRAAGVAQKYNCALVRLDDQQEQGLMSSLPLGQNHINIQRGLTTSSAAIFVPFVTQELFQGGGAMYYGVNAKTHNMIMLDRKLARCPNGLKLGTPGSGKSMSCKSEIVSVFLTTPDDIFVCDPEAEYFPLVQRLHGQVIKLSPTSRPSWKPWDGK